MNFGRPESSTLHSPQGGRPALSRVPAPPADHRPAHIQVVVETDQVGVHPRCGPILADRDHCSFCAPDAPIIC